MREIQKIFSENLRLFYRFPFFLKTFSEKMRLFLINVRVFQRFNFFFGGTEAFLKHLKKNGGFF
jgi:hypothetical protein